MENRIKFLDIARGIAIILMVCGHADNWGEISKFTGLFNMVVFIFISGYLFRDKKINTIKELIKYCWNKCKKIYIFYAFWEIIYFSLRNLFFSIGFLNTTVDYGNKIIEPITSIKEYIFGIIKILCGMGREPFCAAFWFLISLIFVIIIFASINYISNKTKYANVVEFILSLVCFLIGCSMFYFLNIPRLSPAFTLTFAYYLGNLYFRNQEKIKFNNIVIACLSLIVLIILNSYGTISMNSNNIQNPLFFMICSIAGIYLIMFIAKLLENKSSFFGNMIEYIGKRTLIIMAIHIISFKIIMYVQFLNSNITYEQLGILTGANNTNILFVLYVMIGIVVPMIIDFLWAKIKNLKYRINYKRV